MTIISSVESILEDLHRYVIQVSNCVSDKDQELQEFIPIDLSDIPNKMGINLCSVKDIEWEKQDNGELTYVKINFLPADPERINEATPNKYSVQKQRLRETKRKQIEAIDNQSQSSKERIRNQYKKRVEAINKQQDRERAVRKSVNTR